MSVLWKWTQKGAPGWPSRQRQKASCSSREDSELLGSTPVSIRKSAPRSRPLSEAANGFETMTAL